ncbi:MAG: hypothetical protein ACC618_03940 [Patescibacteria group bacterium]
MNVDELNADMSFSFRGNPAFLSGKDVIRKQGVVGLCVGGFDKLDKKKST